MSILRYSALFLLIAAPVFAQQDYALKIPVSKFYYTCAGRMGPTREDNNPGYISDQGYIGLFQFSVKNAYDAGLCSNPVPIMRNQQIWKLCDFKGPIAQKYDIHSQFDFRYDRNAEAAQFEMMNNLTAIYDKYIYQKRYDAMFNKFYRGLDINPDLLRALLHAKGYAAVDEFLHGIRVQDKETTGPYSLGACFNQCLLSEGKQWTCQ